MPLQLVRILRIDRQRGAFKTFHAVIKNHFKVIIFKEFTINISTFVCHSFISHFPKQILYFIIDKLNKGTDLRIQLSVKFSFLSVVIMTKLKSVSNAIAQSSFAKQVYFCYSRAFADDILFEADKSFKDHCSFSRRQASNQPFRKRPFFSQRFGAKGN